MPVIKVWCLPKQTEDQLNQLHQVIVGAVVSVKELNLQDENDMTCLFVPDMMKYGLGEEIIVEIGGLFKKPKRTDKVLQHLASNIGEEVASLYPDAKIECFVTSFNPIQGFWTSDTKKAVSECNVHGSIEHMQSITGICPGCDKP